MKTNLPPNIVNAMPEDSLAGLPLDRMMTDASIDQIIALDRKFVIKAWNMACENITGIPATDAIGRSIDAIYPRVIDCPMVMAALNDAIKGLKSFLPWEKGTYLGNGHFEQHFVPLVSDNENKGVLLIIHDVAHRIKAEQELLRLNHEVNKRSLEIQRSKEELANFNWIASHDLKEPLRKIYFFIEMVATTEGGQLSDNARSSLRRAQSAVQRMGLLTDDIVTFSQVTAPTGKPEEFALQDALNVALKKDQKLISDCKAIIDCSAMPVITGYREMICLLFYHIIDNALKFQSPGVQPQITIACKMVSGTQLQKSGIAGSGQYHCITIQDNGIGFEPDYAEKVFGMFQRLHAQGTYKGTGMGLAICRKIAEAHEGFMSATSELGKGTIITCYLKCHNSEL